MSKNFMLLSSKTLMLIICLAAFDVFAQDNWQLINPSPLTENFLDLCVLNSQTCWVVGHSAKILKTTDSGKNWKVIDTGAGEDVQFTSVCFTDSMNGYITGLNGMILHSGDGGKSWHNQLEYTYTALKEIFFC